MSRLLLVDDNPSIHKIAETLLARTGIELVCAESATQALDLVKQGEHFDVALLDTVMSGMDGWELLDELRKLPATAAIPIAMMAGVLDTVDPVRIQNAPIQGFLKKPVELRDLADRVQKLLDTPVEPPRVVEEKPKISPFETMPATRLKDLPELRHLSPQTLSSGEELEVPAAPEPAVALELDAMDDLLELTDEDLLPEDEAVSVSQEMEAPVVLEEISEESLDLEELDLDSLRELPPPEVQVGILPTPIRLQPLSESILDFTPPQGYQVPDLSSEVLDLPVESAPASAPEASLQAAMVDLPDLGPMDENPFDLEISSEPEDVAPLEPVAFDEPELQTKSSQEGMAPLPSMDDFSFDLTEDSDSLLKALEPVPSEFPETGSAEVQDTEVLLDEMNEPLGSDLPEEDLEYLEETLSGIGMPPMATAHAPVFVAEEDATDPGIRMAPVAEAPEPVTSDVSAEPSEAPLEASPETLAAQAETPSLLPAEATASQRELLDTILADSMLMEALSKAVVAKLGDKVLREIAWEVIPELAERLPSR